VGEYYEGNPYDNYPITDGVLLTETAGSWAPGVEATPPFDARQGEVVIRAVSCPSPGNCSAVGSYPQVGGAKQGLLLTETAGVWAQGIEAALPANASQNSPYVYAELTSVSCASAGNCSAVGTYPDGSGGQGLLVTETAGSWGPAVEATLPADANTATEQEVNLTSVSCASAGNCTAVGSYLTSSGSQGLMLTETAGSWAPGVEAVLPADAATTNQDAFLSSVSCPSAGNCSAVGLYDDFGLASGPPSNLQVSVGKGLLLAETAGSWAPGVEAALPANAQTPQGLTSLSSVSCPSAGNCGAVGTYVDSSGLQGLLLSETAGNWAAGTEALPASAPVTGQEWGLAPGSGVGLQSVSCPSAGNCSAVGGYWDGSGNAKGLLLTEDAGNWQSGQLASLPANANPHPFAALYSVSCPSAANCSAGGVYEDKYNGDGGAGGLLIGGSPAPVKLEIAKSGSGSGSVTSVPAGIDCGSTCSASFDAGTLLTLSATASPGSLFTGWSGGGPGCIQLAPCQPNTGISDQTVTANFELLPPPSCIVPGVKGKTLARAKALISKAHCGVGKVRKAPSRKAQRGRVISQNPRAGWKREQGAKVNLVVGTGRR
jgi:hypothetical protein